MAPVKFSRMALPKHWTGRIRASVLHVVSLAQYSLAYVRGWAADSAHPRLRSKAELEQLQQEVMLLREEIRLKDARMGRIAAHRRPYFAPTERMAILELRAARCWSLEQTARAFLLNAATIASWIKRIHEAGPYALVQLREPANKFPEFVAYVVQRLKTLCPRMGSVKIAETLARAGLHLGATSVRRMLRTKPRHMGETRTAEVESAPRIVTAKYRNHVWHVDLTAMPTMAGFWTPWLPGAMPQCWPFCWWLAVVLDHYSRRVMGLALFKSLPTSEQVRSMLVRTIRMAQGGPRYIICDRGAQFDCMEFKAWCRRRGIRPRFCAVGKYGGLAVMERAILTIKQVCRRSVLVPLRGGAFRGELESIIMWLNEYRPHTGLSGRTPNEKYYGRRPANRAPRFEPRARWPGGAPCARPWALVKGKPGVKLELDVTFHAGRKYLPIVQLRRAA